MSNSEIPWDLFESSFLENYQLDYPEISAQSYLSSPPKTTSPSETEDPLQGPSAPPLPDQSDIMITEDPFEIDRSWDHDIIIDTDNTIVPDSPPQLESQVIKKKKSTQQIYSDSEEERIANQIKAAEESEDSQERYQPDASPNGLLFDSVAEWNLFISDPSLDPSLRDYLTGPTQTITRLYEQVQGVYDEFFTGDNALTPQEAYQTLIAHSKEKSMYPKQIFLSHRKDGNIERFAISYFEFKTKPFGSLKYPDYYPQPPGRFLGVSKAVVHTPLLYMSIERGLLYKADSLISLRRSRPSWHIYESLIETKSKHQISFSTLLDTHSVTQLIILGIFNNIIGRGINIEEIFSERGMGDDPTTRTIRYWFQVKMVIRENIPPKTPPSITFTSEILTTNGDNKWLKSIILSLLIWTHKLMSKAGLTEYFNMIGGDTEIGHLHSLSIFFYVPKPNTVGGCQNFYGQKLLSRKFKKMLYNPNSTYNNCLFWCLKYMEGNEIDDLSINEMRASFGFTDGSPIDVQSISAIANYYDVDFKIYHVVKDVSNNRRVFRELIHHRCGDQPTPNCVKLILYKNHYQLVTNPNVLKWTSCNKCHEWFKDINKHVSKCKLCDQCGLKLSSKHKCRAPKQERQKHKSVRKVNNKMLVIPDLTNIWICDFETFMVGHEMVVYAAAICNLRECLDQKPVTIFYGRESLNNFMAHILGLKGIVVFYNGSRFDYYFIINWCIRNNIQLKEFVKDADGNRITNLKIKKLKFWDLCLFTSCSLASLCRSLKIDEKFWKHEFDHTLIQSWKSVKIYKSTVVPYLRYDIISLAHCFDLFTSTMHRLYLLHPLRSPTLAAYAYDVWRTYYVSTENLKKIKISLKEEYYWFHDRALYGGRCCPQVQRFISRQYLSLERMMQMDPEEREIYFNMIDDYVVLLDVVSLYPFVSKRKYPIGEPRWMDNTDDFLMMMGDPSREDEIRRSFVEVDVECPRNILTAFLFARDHNHDLVVDLEPKYNQVYDGASLIEAYKLGYRVTKCYKWLRYPYLENILDSYMTNCITEKGKHPKDSAEYFVHKSMGNSNTGKFNQQAINIKQHITSNDMVFEDELMLKIKKIEPFELNDETIGYYYEERVEERVTKPSHIGVNILSNSREYMSETTRAFNGYYDTKHMPMYGDTDSVLVHKSVCDLNIPFFGDEWGQLKKEYGNAKIVRAFMLAPKTYALEYLVPHKEKGFEIKWHIRAKGIPKSKIADNELSYNNIVSPIVPRTPIELRETLYSVYNREGDFIYATPGLTIKHFEDMSLKKYYTVVAYASLDKFLARKGKLPYIELDHLKHRTINYNDWWTKGKRIIDNETGVSYPVGFNK